MFRNITQMYKIHPLPHPPPPLSPPLLSVSFSLAASTPRD